MTRIGFGYDSHVFEAGKPLFLGGVLIPGADGLKAHSDGDVLIHALIDALFGAAAMGDIGSHFPDTDDRWKDVNSMMLLESAVAEVSAEGYRVSNVDLTVVCERPRIRPYADDIRASIAGALGIDVACVSVKAKTNEGMDAVGEGRGMAVWAAVLLDR